MCELQPQLAAMRHRQELLDELVGSHSTGRVLLKDVPANRSAMDRRPTHVSPDRGLPSGTERSDFQILVQQRKSRRADMPDCVAVEMPIHRDATELADPYSGSNSHAGHAGNS